MKRGDVVYWPLYAFDNGTASTKLFVIIGCDKDGGWLMLRTTTREREDRPDAQGCHADQSVFRFKEYLGGFKEPTWVQFELPNIREEREVFNAKANIIFSLKREDIQAIINCYKKSEEMCSWLAAYCA